MVQTDFMSLTYALEGQPPQLGHDGGIRLSLSWQVLTYALPFALLALAGVKFSFSNSTQKSGRRFVRALALMPLMMVVFSIVGGSGLRSMWGAPAAIWIGVTAT